MPHPASSYAWGIKECNNFVAVGIGTLASRLFPGWTGRKGEKPSQSDVQRQTQGHADPGEPEAGRVGGWTNRILPRD